MKHLAEIANKDPFLNFVFFLSSLPEERRIREIAKIPEEDPDAQLQYVASFFPHQLLLPIEKVA